MTIGYEAMNHSSHWPWRQIGGRQDARRSITVQLQLEKLNHSSIHRKPSILISNYSGMLIRGHYACTSGRVISNDTVMVSEKKIIKTDMSVKTVDLEIVIQQYL